MKDLSYFNHIYINTKPVDFRKQAHGLALLCEYQLKIMPQKEKYLFVFTNKRKTAVKLLYWDSSGYALWWKTLERERFRWPKTKEQVMKIQAKQLKWLLDGIDFSKLKIHQKIDFSTVNSG